jgi:hypothetical protein
MNMLEMMLVQAVREVCNTTPANPVELDHHHRSMARLSKLDPLKLRGMVCFAVEQEEDGHVNLALAISGSNMLIEVLLTGLRGVVATGRLNHAMQNGQVPEEDRAMLSALLSNTEAKATIVPASEANRGKQ